MWTEGCNDEFFELKNLLMSSPLHVLALPNFSLDFVLDTDASGDGLGAALSQISNGEEWVLGYASRALIRSERNATMEWVPGYASRALSRSERRATKKGDACLGVDCSPLLVLPLWKEVYLVYRPSFPAMVTLIQGIGGAGCPLAC